MYHKQKLALIVTGVFVLLIGSTVIPFGFSPITNRPTVYTGNITAEPVQVEAGTTANIDTTGMVITGAQVWLWLSTSGGAGINVALGDRPYAGPFLLSELVDTLTTHTYTFSPSDLSALCDSLSITSPFAMEGKTYTFLIGNDWINGSVPLLVQGKDVDYWIKIADVAPADAIAGTEIAVSTNRVHFLRTFFAGPLLGAPGQQVSVSGYAIEATNLYNITQGGAFFITQVVGLIPATTHNESGWFWTGFSVSFNIIDLELKNDIAPTSSSPVNITLFNSESPTEGATWIFSEYWREVYLPANPPSNPTEIFRTYQGDYSSVFTVNAGSEYALALKNFPCRGSAQIALESFSIGELVKTDIAFNYQGDAYTEIIIPFLETGDYDFSVVDNHNVEYIFKIHLVNNISTMYHTVVVENSTYVVETCSNSSVSDLSFNEGLKRLRLSVDGESSSIGFCNVTVPAELMWGGFSLYLDDVALVEGVDYTQSNNGTHFLFSITYSHSTHVVELFSTEVVPDFAGWLFLPFIVLATMAALGLKKRFRK